MLKLIFSVLFSYFPGVLVVEIINGILFIESTQTILEHTDMVFTLYLFLWPVVIMRREAVEHCADWKVLWQK